MSPFYYMILCVDGFKLSMVPDITDASFAGNPSRVTMGYKLFGFTQLIKEKERYFREALRWRLRMMAHFMGKLASPELDPEAVEREGHAHHRKRRSGQHSCSSCAG